VIKHGDVFLAKLGPTQGSKTDHERAVVVMSGEAINKNNRIVVVVARGNGRPSFRAMSC
jgi:mRNA-degrading endonuclease toxin of MazEF toxin-antitoxin module